MALAAGTMIGLKEGFRSERVSERSGAVPVLDTQESGVKLSLGKVEWEEDF